MAFFQPGFCPRIRPRRFGFGWALITVTASTPGLHAHLEQLLHGLADLRLVRVGMDVECVLALLDQLVALLRDDRREQNLVWMQAHDALPWTCSSAPSLTSSERAQTTWCTSSSAGTVTTTRSRLRNDLISASSSGCATTRTGRAVPPPPSGP